MDTASKTSDATVALANGAKGDSVKELQGLLTKKGFEVKSDGAFGEKTEKAVRDYQTKNSLKVDGQAGKVTLESLRKVTV